MRVAAFALSLVTVAAAGSGARADWYNGDPYTSFPNIPQAAFFYPSAPQLHLGFTPFNWVPGSGGGQVGVVGGMFHSFGVVPGANIVSAYWEIRSGVSAGNGGLLVASGSGVPTATPTAFTQGGYPVVDVALTVPTFNLPAGSYWFAMAIGDSPVGGWFVASTTGFNSVNGITGGGSSIYYQTAGGNVGWDYVPLTPETVPTWTDTGNSYYIREVPSPSGAGVLAAGLLVAARRRR